jgi:hypothetical protein
MFKPFFVHFNRPTRHSDSSKLRHMPRGFTLKVSPGSEPRTINVQTAWCSARDEFVKKTGRAFAEDAPITTINPRDLPRFALNAEHQCVLGARWEGSYLHLLKYVV